MFKLNVVLGADTFSVEGEEPMNEILAQIFTSFVNAREEKEGAQEVARLTDAIDGSNTNLQIEIDKIKQGEVTDGS